MSIKLQDAKLFVTKNNEPLHITFLQSDQILFNLETIADRSPINILLPIIEGNEPIIIKINDIKAEILPDNLELQATYKLLLENGQLTQETISANDNFALIFKVKSTNIVTGNTAQTIMNGSTLTNLQQTSLKHKLIDQGKGTSNYQSASSLRHTIPEISFSQAQRFDKDITLRTEFNYNVPSVIGNSNRSTGFGYGNKYICPLFVIRNAEQNPPPNAYFSETQKKPSQYRKTNWSQSDRFKMSSSVGLGPSPVSYDVTQTIGQNKPSCTIGAKIKPLPTFQESVPAPNKYDLKTDIVESARFHNISLGYGNKSDFTKNDKTPGPGTYEQPSVFKNSSNSILTNGTLRTNILQK